MDNIRASIDLMFNRRKCESIIDSHFGMPHNRADQKVNKDWFVRHFRNDYNIYSNDQIESIHKILEDKWMKPPQVENSGKNSSIFNLLLHFTNEVLIQNSNEPECSYENLLRWHEISHKVGEDLLTTSFLAAQDIGQGRDRNYFSWRPVITHDNPAIKHILKKGVADLHFHLKGSSLIFELNWLSLMNSIDNCRGECKELEKKLQSPDIQTDRTIRTENLHSLCVKACAVRLVLFRKLFDTEFKDDCGELLELIKLQNPNELVCHTGMLQYKLNLIKNEFGHRYGKSVVDYAIPKNMTEVEISNQNSYTNSILSGERRLLYNVFRKIYSCDADFSGLSTLFYAYLVIKEKVRHEIIQLNDKIGFGNFAQYGKRKTLFIPNGSVYDTLMINLAINSTRENQDVTYLEARITPKNRTYEIASTIKWLDNQVVDKRFLKPSDKRDPLELPADKREKRPDKFQYILHFNKEKPEPIKEDAMVVSSRNHKVRTKVKQQAFAINKLRMKAPNKGTRIVGIDAASTEIGCRAEVFAQVFRYLKNHSLQQNYEYLVDNKIGYLGSTYHVGEDYLDIADGLRAIDEAILFLNLKRGDRLGHALALGIDADLYYTGKNKNLVMPKQDFLDNVVWMIVKSKEFGLNISSELMFKLKNWYERYYRNIYQDWDQDGLPSCFTYYQSWLLRGDCPDIYRNYENLPVDHNISFWNKCSTNRFTPEIKTARENRMARALYSRYHFDPEVRKRGGVSDEYRICSNYISMITDLQREMRNMIAKQHICIETNLTSNKLIGAFKRYSSHPITKFYNNGLLKNNDFDINCPQISVSINTDDQGVFCTSVENEFSLMALSLEKQLNSDKTIMYHPRMIYQWLDNVRELAFEQKFSKGK